MRFTSSNISDDSVSHHLPYSKMTTGQKRGRPAKIVLNFNWNILERDYVQNPCHHKKLYRISSAFERADLNLWLMALTYSRSLTFCRGTRKTFHSQTNAFCIPNSSVRISFQCFTKFLFSSYWFWLWPLSKARAIFLSLGFKHLIHLHFGFHHCSRLQ